MRSSVIFAVLIGAPLIASAQTLPHKVGLPADSPVTLVSDDWSGSAATQRGGAFFVDVRAQLSLKNSGQRRIRSVTLAVLAQEVTLGGKGSVSVPSLDVAPGDTFPIGIDLHLLRPAGGSGGPGVEVRLDGVLFDDLSFYGPDKLQSRRTMTVWELEARRDRQYFKKLMDQGGREALQSAMVDSLADRPRTLWTAGHGRATNADPERELQFAFLHLPDAPIEAVSGTARIVGNEAHAPRVDVHNRTDRAIRYLEIGWIVKDQQGREFQAASMPADLTLGPGKTSQVVQDAALRFPERTSIQSMTGFVSTVEFSDGSFWIPSRTALGDAKFRRIVAPSPEEQRLAQIYLKRGLAGLVEELKKF
jgi:hypothetical protein